jgi:hypothetical protein
MTNKQRLIYSIIIALSVLVIMLGLSHLQSIGVLERKDLSVHRDLSWRSLWWCLNGFMRRKVKH